MRNLTHIRIYLGDCCSKSEHFFKILEKVRGDVSLHPSSSYTPEMNKLKIKSISLKYVSKDNFLILNQFFVIIVFNGKFSVSMLFWKIQNILALVFSDIPAQMGAHKSDKRCTKNEVFH